MFPAWRPNVSEATPGQLRPTLFSCLLPSPFPRTSLNPFSLVTHPHLKMIPLVGVEILTKIIKPCWIKNYRSAQIDEWSLRKMDLRLSVGLTCCGAMEEADPAQCASNVPALCAAVERASVSQSYVVPCAVEQACEFQGNVDFDDRVATVP